MKFFSKKERPIPSGTLTQQIGAYLLGRQRKLADYLNARTARCSKRAVLYGLIVFCSGVGSYLLYLLLAAFGAFNS